MAHARAMKIRMLTHGGSVAPLNRDRQGADRSSIFDGAVFLSAKCFLREIAFPAHYISGALSLKTTRGYGLSR